MNLQSLPGMVDLSCVSASDCKANILEMIELAKKYHFICCFTLPAYAPFLTEQLRDTAGVAAGGTVGFPSGGELPETKAETARRLFAIGCREIDMVINIGALKDGDNDTVTRDICGVRNAVPNAIMKVILEVSLLNDEEIKRGSLLAARAGVDFVKTGTGWTGQPVTTRHIQLIREAVGTSVRIKAAGGIRTLATLEALQDAGCSRFGIGVKSIRSILNELEERS